MFSFGSSHLFPSYDRQINIMACTSSSSCSGLDLFARPVAFVVSDQELPNDGHSVVLSCILRKYFGYHGVS